MYGVLIEHLQLHFYYKSTYENTKKSFIFKHFCKSADKEYLCINIKAAPYLFFICYFSQIFPFSEGHTKIFHKNFFSGYRKIIYVTCLPLSRLSRNSAASIRSAILIFTQILYENLLLLFYLHTNNFFFYLYFFL
jgi:hypothetical protein